MNDVSKSFSPAVAVGIAPLMLGRTPAAATRPLPSWLLGIWKHRWFALLALASLALGGWEAMRVYLGPAVVVDAVARGNLVATVVASGNVETPFRVEIGSQITGTVDDVLVEEGQRVRKGQPLVAVEARELKAAVVQAEGAVAQAEARMRQLQELTLPAAREALNQARATQLDAQRIYDRAAELAKNGYATKASLDDAQKNLDVARTQTRTAELQVFTSGNNAQFFTAVGAQTTEQVGLTAVANNPATNMSGGQQQRVAIARALAMNPDLVLADEPTGNLDTKSADSAFSLMRDVNRQNGTTFLIVTHNLDLARRCDRIIEVVDGRIVPDQASAKTM